MGELVSRYGSGSTREDDLIIWVLLFPLNALCGQTWVLQKRLQYDLSFCILVVVKKIWQSRIQKKKGGEY